MINYLVNCTAACEDMFGAVPWKLVLVVPEFRNTVERKRLLNHTHPPSTACGPGCLTEIIALAKELEKRVNKYWSRQEIIRVNTIPVGHSASTIGGLPRVLGVLWPHIRRMLPRILVLRVVR